MRRNCYIAICVFYLITVSAMLLGQSGESSNLVYTPDEIRYTSAETFLALMARPEQGYERFAAMNALGKKAKESDAANRKSILSMVIAAMKDKSRTENQRFQCCYVISICGDEQGVPDLIDVLQNDKSEIMRSVAVEALADFSKCTAAHDALVQALKYETSTRVRETLTKRLGDLTYTPEEISSILAESFMGWIANPEPGYHRFAAMWALGKKAKGSDAANRKPIMTMVVTVMNDKSRTENQRFQCCYVISECGDEQWVPDLINILQNDKSDTMRSVAVEALANFPKCAIAHDALLQAASYETSGKVREVLARRLGDEMPKN